MTSQVEVNTIKSLLLASFSLIEENILVYRNLAGRTPRYYEEAFLMGKRIIQKHRCCFVICHFNDVVTELSAARSIHRFLPPEERLLQCLVFVLPEPDQWEQLRAFMLMSEIRLNCKVIVVRSQEEALHLFQEMELEYEGY